MSKKSTNPLLMIITIILLSACKTVDKSVEKMVFQRQSAPIKQSDPHKNSFIRDIQGNYEMIDGKTFTVDGSGFFKLGETEFFLQEVLNGSQAVYASAEPSTNSRKKVYTYHGIMNTGKRLLSVAHKAPSDNTRLLTKKDTEYAWEVNTFQAENINWESGFATPFATRVDLKR